MRPGLACSRESKCAASGWLRHFLFTWLKTQGIDDALIEPYCGHASRTSLEIYSRLAPPGARPATTASSANRPLAVAVSAGLRVIGVFAV